MYDIMIARGNATENGETVFAKNSDRDVNESQLLEFHTADPQNSERFEYLDIPDETFAVIISRPWWIWGAEMGANESGVVVGNTAVFTKDRVDEEGILGMDYVRLALERCDSARKALKFLKKNISKHGQGGNASYDKKLRYNNSFVIADSRNAYVLETVGRKCAHLRVKDVYSISNAITIDELIKYSDRVYTFFSRGRERRKATMKLLEENYGRITAETMMRALGHHPPGYHPSKGSMRDVCMHYGGLLRPSQTASSQVSVLGDEVRHYFTAASNPCLSVFKPVTFEKLPDELGKGGNVFSSDSYWWRSEKFRRRFQMSYEAVTEFSREKDKLQKKILEMNDIGEILRLEDEFYSRWWSRVVRMPLSGNKLWGWRWKKANKKAKLLIP